MLLLPFAVSLAEPLEISRPVDRELFTNVHELMRIWNCWHPHLKPVPIEADIQEQPRQQPSRATAALFSGGVDSWFTLLKHNGDFSQPDGVRIDDLLRVLGLDIPLEGVDERRAVRDSVERATSGLKTHYVEVATNLMKTRWWAKADWGRVAHGCAFASVGHALSGRYGKVLIPSTLRYDEAVPWGTHPLTDPLLFSATKCIHAARDSTALKRRSWWQTRGRLEFSSGVLVDARLSKLRRLQQVLYHYGHFVPAWCPRSVFSFWREPN